MSAIELSLQQLGILSGVRRVCEDAGVSLGELEAVIRSAFAAERPASSVSPSVLPSSEEEACRMMVDALRDLGADTLSVEGDF